MKNGPLTALRDGDSPQFEMDFLGGEGGGRIGDSPRDLAPCVRVSRRARRLSVRVYPDARVEVVVPPRARAREVELFVNAHRQWIDDKRTAALRSRPPPEPFPPATIHFQATGESWRLHLAGGERERLVVPPLPHVRRCLPGAHYGQVAHRHRPELVGRLVWRWCPRRGHWLLSSASMTTLVLV